MIKVFTLIAFVNVFWGVREFKWIDLKPVLVDTIYFIQRFNNNKFLLSFISCNTLRYNVLYTCLKFDDNANWLHKFYSYTFGVQTIVYEDYVPTHSSAFYALKVLSKSRFSVN